MNAGDELRSTSCSICPLNKEDAYWLFNLFNEQGIKDNIPGLSLFSSSPENTLIFIEGMNKLRLRASGFLWKILLNNYSIGFICVIDFDESPSLCYALAKNYRKRGFMTESLFTVLSYLDSIKKSSYTCQIHPSNTPSINLVKRLSHKHSITIIPDYSPHPS